MSPGPGDKMILIEKRRSVTLCPTAGSEHFINGNNRLKGVCGVVLRGDILRFQGRK